MTLKEGFLFVHHQTICSEISGIKELSAFRFKSKKEGRSDKHWLAGVGLNKRVS